MSLKEIKDIDSLHNMIGIFGKVNPSVVYDKRMQILFENYQKGSILLNQVYDEIYDSASFSSGDISVRNIKKFEEYSGKEERGIMRAYSVIAGPFGHAALMDASEGKTEFSEVLGRFEHRLVPLEEMMTHDRYRVDSSKLLTDSGKELVAALIESNTMNVNKENVVAVLDSLDQDQKIHRYMQELFEAAIEKQLSGIEEKTVGETPEDIPQDIKDMSSLIKWVHKRNEIRKKKGLEEIDLNEVLSANPESSVQIQEATKQYFRLKLQQEKFQDIRNSPEAQIKAYVRSLAYSQPVGYLVSTFERKTDPRTVPLSGTMICSQFAFSILLKALADVEDTLKKEGKALPSTASGQLMKIPEISEYRLASTTPEMLLKTFQNSIDPVPAPKILQELVDAKPEFFEPAKIQSTLGNIISAVAHK